VRQFYRPNWLTRQEIYDQNQANYQDKIDAYLAMSDRYTQGLAEESRVGNPACTGGASINVYNSHSCGHSNINNHSMVTVMRYATSTVVVPGDNEPPSWKELLTQRPFVEETRSVGVFMASHHGRESGYCGEVFANEGKPRIFAISDAAFQDTSATSRYSAQASGWMVNKRSGGQEERNAVTTRSDGYIDVEMGFNGGNPYLSVKVD
jgi:competence protein ComEC